MLFLATPKNNWVLEAVGCRYIFIKSFCVRGFMPSLWLLVGQSAHLSRVQNSRQLILVFGGIYSSKTWMASHARKLFTSFAQAHARASFAQARNHASRESEKPRKPSPKTASRLHRASKSARKLRISSSRKVAQAPFEKLTARKLPLWSRKDGARISRKDE